jgi:hypothetical protein
MISSRILAFVLLPTKGKLWQREKTYRWVRRHHYCVRVTNHATTNGRIPARNDRGFGNRVFVEMVLLPSKTTYARVDDHRASISYCNATKRRRPPDKDILAVSPGRSTTLATTTANTPPLLCDIAVLCLE